MSEPMIVHLPLDLAPKAWIAERHRIAAEQDVRCDVLKLGVVWKEDKFVRRMRVWFGEMPKSKRPKCEAKTRKGTPCQAPCV